jgi:hypothetical protein
MTAWVFVEGAAHALLLSRVLEDLAPQVRFRIVTADGQDTLRAMARTTLVTERQPVALVVDSDTSNTSQSANQLQELNDYLAWVAGPTPFKVVQFQPEMEVIFFHWPDVLAAMTGRRLPPELARVGKTAPRAVLQTLFPMASLAARIKALPPEQISELTKSREIAELRAFLTMVCAANPTPA